MLKVELSSGVGEPGVTRSTLEVLLAFVFERAGSPGTSGWSVTVRIADSSEISRLHDDFFGDPSDTDVMSFPSGEYPQAEGGYLGDIVVSIEMARAQAGEHGHSTEREVLFLAAHGLLHLLGFDDTDEPDRARMLAMQQDLLNDFERLNADRIGR